MGCEYSLPQKGKTSMAASTYGHLKALHKLFFD